MKDMKYYLRFITLMSCILFIACSDDDKETKPVFPELQNIECAVGDEKTLTFEATNNWTLTSSALWCFFVVDGEEVYSCSGTAGHQSVTIRISNDAAELMKSYKAELNLMAGGAQQVIFTVTRPTTGYEVHIFNADQSVEYTSENPLVQEYDGSRIVVTANADWIIEPSEGMNLNNSFGLANENVEIKLSMNDGFHKAASRQTLTFKNKENEVVAQLPVNYAGIPEDRIEFSNKNAAGTAITFTYDGSSYNSDLEAPMPITVISKDDAYTRVYVEYTEALNEESYEYEYVFTCMDEDDSWIYADIDYKHKDIVELSTGVNSGKIRTGYLMIFPNALYEQIKGNFETEVFSPEGINGKYEENIAARIEQAANPDSSRGFAITDENDQPVYDSEGTLVAAMASEDEDEALIEKYGTTNVFVLSLPKSDAFEGIVITPNGFTGYYLQADTYWKEEDTLWEDIRFEPGMKSLTLGFESGVSGNKTMVVTFIDPETGDPYAVLLVDPRW